MAQPIPLKVAPRNLQEELRSRMERAPDEHAEAILAAYALLQEMHNQGVLDIARGVLSVQNEILQTVAADASIPESVRAIRNLLFCRRILGGIEPERFQAIFEAIPEGIAQATAVRRKPDSVFGLLRRLISRESLRAMAAAIDLLHCLGGRLLAIDGTSPTPKSTSSGKA
ncbi:MAG: hypothetical protein WB622_04405 [Acidobacteriaceae bacterium]